MDKKMQDLTEFGSTWWGKKWIESMLTMGKFMRMQRGINYTKEHRVSDIIIKKGEIFAQCLGTAPVPYRIKIKFDKIPPEKWDLIIQKLSEHVLIEAQLLSNELPKDINDIFLKNKIPLFPPIKEDLNAECTCPDKEIPCKHIAAVILSSAKIFDYDPFLILKLRGMEKEELLIKIEQNRFPNLDLKIEMSSMDINDNIESVKISEIKSDEFFFPNYKDAKVPVFNITELSNPESILERIKTPPEISKDKDFMETITKIYLSASKFANELINKNEEKEIEKEKEI